MKPKKSSAVLPLVVGAMPHTSSCLLISLALWQASSSELQAVAHYWDNNGATTGFGNAGGTWGSSVFWNTVSSGLGAPTVTTLTTSDQANFGTDTSPNGLGGGTITVSGTVNAASLRFGSQTTSAVTLSGGIINLADVTSIHVGSGTPTHVITSQITGAATTLTKTGNSLRLDFNNTYTGQTIISSGTLILNNSAALGGNNPGTNGTSSISMGANSTLQSNYAPADAGISDSYVYAPITLTAAGTNNFLIGNGNSTSPAESVRLNLNGAIGGTAGANVVLGNTTANRNNADSIIVLGAASTYNGNTTIQAGGTTANRITVIAGVENALPTTTVLGFDSVGGSGSGRTSTFDLDGNNQTLAGLDNGGVVAADRNLRVTSATAATLTINNTNPYIFGGATKDSDVSPTTGFGTITRAQITGAISLVKNGAGTFTLGGTLTNGGTAGGNTFTGDTKILGGILELGETTSIQNSAFDTAGSIAGDAGNGLRTTVTTLRLGGLTGDKDFSDVFTSTAGGYDGLTALTLNPGTGVTNSYAGDIGDGATGMTLTKTGAGTQVLTGANTHTGGTTITNAANGGNLRITHAGALGTGAVSIQTAGSNTGALELALTGTNTITNTFSGFSSAFTLTTTGSAQIVNTSGTNKITSDLTIVSTGGNGLNVESNGGLLELSGTITSTVAAGSRTFSIGGSGDGLVSGAIANDTVNSHALAVTKSGSGTWTLSGVSTYLGNTTVVGGTLALTSTSELAFAIGLSEVNNKITGTGSGIVTLDGAFTFDLTAAGTGPADFWNIVDLANLSGSSAFTENFNVVDFTDDGGGIWSKDNGGTIYQFSQGTGLLTVIPEPSSALLGALGAMLLLRRRR